MGAMQLVGRSLEASFACHRVEAVQFMKGEVSH
jgi:hypothetical protein